MDQPQWVKDLNASIMLMSTAEKDAWLKEHLFKSVASN